MFWILLIVGLIFFLYFIVIKPFTYWSERNVPQLEIWNLWKIIFQAIFVGKPLAEISQAMYDSIPNQRYVGAYQMFKPCVLLKDPELIKQITVKDFDHFVDHNPIPLNNREPLWEKNLINLQGDTWRDMRATLSPSFTSSKMKLMFGLINECAETFVNFFESGNANIASMEMKDAFARFTNDVIASIAFGITCDSMRDRDNEFYVMGKEVSKFGGIKVLFLLMAPRLSKLFGITLFGEAINNFFKRIIKDNIEIRQREGIVRMDMLHLLLEARKERLKHGDTIGDTGATESNKKHQKQQLSDEDITAQAFVFFLAGFDTVSSAMSFMAYELAVNPDTQTRLLNEIDDTLNDCEGSVTYEALTKMKYLDMVISETLRKWPPAVMFDHRCVKPYTIEPIREGENAIQFKVGDVVILPVYGIQRDPLYYPDPERFDPERFSEDNKSNINSFLAFGIGPRACIGNRFALLEIKILFFHILSKFEFTVVEKTPIPLKLGSNPLSMTAKDGFWLGLKSRKDNA